MSKEFLKAVFDNRFKDVEKFLEDPKLDINFEHMSKTDGMMSAVDLAASLGHTQILELLLKDPRLKIRPNATTGRTPLHLAVGYRQVKACEMLIPYCEILAETNSGKLAYDLAKDGIRAPQSQEDKQKFLEIKNLLKVPTFVSACADGNLNIVRDLVEDKVDINGMFGEGSGLLVASLNYEEEVVDYLLSLADINVNQKDSRNKYTILHLLSRTEVVNGIPVELPVYTADGLTKAARIAQKLIDKGALIDSVGGSNGATPLRLAVSFKRIDMVKVLVENGADLTIQYSSNNPKFDDLKTDIFELAKTRTPEIYRFLKEYKYFRGEHNFHSAKKILSNFLSGKIDPTKKQNVTINENELTEPKITTIKNPC